MLKRIIATAIAASFAMSAQANDTMNSVSNAADSVMQHEMLQNVYVGGALGMASFDVDDAMGDVDDSDTSFKLFAGYEFNETWAVELGYANFGETSLRYSQTETLFDATYTSNLKATAEVTGLFANLVTNYQWTEQLTGFAKVGFVSWDTDTKATVDFTITDSNGTTTGSDSASASDSGTDMTFGLGLAYKMDKWHFTAEYEVFETEGTIGVFSLGTQYKF